MMNSFELHKQHLEFLVWLNETYGTKLKYVPFTSIMKKYGKVSYPSIWTYMKILTDYGYLELTQSSPNRRIYTIDIDKLSQAKQMIEQLTKKKK